MSDTIEQLIANGVDFYQQQDWVQAEASFRAALALDSENRTANGLLGSVLMRLEDFGGSADCFAKVGDLDLPSFVPGGLWEDAINDWGRTLIELERPDEAIEIYEKLFAINPNYRYTHMNWGRALELQKGNPNRYAQAAEHYEQMVKLDPDNLYAWNNWGRMLIELKQFDEAIKKFKTMIEMDKSFKYAYSNWGRALYDNQELPNRYEQAAKQFAKAIDIDPNFVEAWHDWGLALFSLEQYRAAIEKFQKVLELDGKHKYAHVNWGRALENQKDLPNRYEEAAKQFAKALELDPNYLVALDDWGRMLLNLKRYREAAEKYQKIIEIEPGSIYAYRNWGNALEGQTENPDRFRHAAEKYEAAVKVDPKFTAAWHDWGRMLVELEQYDEAINKYQKALETDPNSSYALLGWGAALQHRKDGLSSVDEALEHYQQAIKLDDKYVDAYHYLGSALITLRRYEEGKEVFNKSISLDPKPAFGHHNLAFLYSRMGQYAESQKWWSAALKAYQNIPENDRTPYDWMYIGNIQAEIFQKSVEGITALEEGLKRFPENVDLLEALIDTNLDLKDRYSYETPENLSAIGSAHWKAWNAYQKLVSALKKKIAAKETALDLAMLGRIQKSMGSPADAEKSLDAALRLDDKDAGSFNDRATLKVRNERMKEALLDFELAVSLEPHNWGYASNLAEAYRKAKRFDEAETAYQTILSVAPAHMDSLIGLGETYASMGDAAREGSHSADAELMYKQAVDCYSKVIDFEVKAERKRDGEPFDASKRLKPRELNAVYYSRGYARVSLYDTQSRKNDLTLIQAQNDFRKVTRYKADENYHKAKRAMSKVFEKLNPTSPQNIEQRTGPIIISLLAFALFVVSLFAFFKGRPEYVSPGFALNEETVTALDAAGIPDDTLFRLEKFIGTEFSTQEGLLAGVELAVGEEAFKSFEDVLLAAPLQEPPELVWKPIEMGYFALLVFGSLIFMVAGLYLQQISKLKFGTIEIEKSSVSQISGSSALGIRK